MISSEPVAGVRVLYLRVLALTYAVALHSLYAQLPGLYGDTGVLPASSMVTNIRSGHRDIMTAPCFCCYVLKVKRC